MYEPTLLQYLSACWRVEKWVAELAKAKGISMQIKIDPERSGGMSASTHAIALICGPRTHVISVDHETFMAEDNFAQQFFLPQIAAAVDELVSSSGGLPRP